MIFLSRPRAPNPPLDPLPTTLTVASRTPHLPSSPPPLGGYLLTYMYPPAQVDAALGPHLRQRARKEGCRNCRRRRNFRRRRGGGGDRPTVRSWAFPYNDVAGDVADASDGCSHVNGAHLLTRCAYVYTAWLPGRPWWRCNQLLRNPPACSRKPPWRPSRPRLTLHLAASRSISVYMYSLFKRITLALTTCASDSLLHLLRSI